MIAEERCFDSVTLYRRRPTGRYYPAQLLTQDACHLWAPGDYLVHIEPGFCSSRPVDPANAGIMAEVWRHEIPIARAVLDMIDAKKNVYSAMDVATAAVNALVEAYAKGKT